MFAMSLGPLIVALIFKFVKDEWDIELCKTIVLSGMACMNLAILVLLFVNEDSFAKKQSFTEDKKLVAEVGGGFFNKVL